MWRALILFINFFLIILAYYHIKPASRSLFLEYLGADSLPYVWISTAVILGLAISFYHRLLERCSRPEPGSWDACSVHWVTTGISHSSRSTRQTDGRRILYIC